jgi:uncharacterized protein with FMN-binding domain
MQRDRTMWRRIQKIVLSLSLIVLFALYALQRQAQPRTAAFVAAIPPATTTIAMLPSPTATATAAAPSEASTSTATSDAAMARLDPTNTPTDVPPTATAAGAFRDGTYTGASADAHWGTVEVQAVVSNGQLSNVVFLQFPNHRNRSQEINSQAMPILTQEAVQAQQANVDVVSGATDTSEAFVESLSSALSQAAR